MSSASAGGGARIPRVAAITALFFLSSIAGVETLATETGTFTVDSTEDAVDADPGNGFCATDEGVCSLRAAIQETNALLGADDIILPAGTYELTIPGRAEDAAATGDLDITDDLTISGAGQDETIIDGGQLDRIFHAFLFFHSELQVNVSDLTIRNGSAELVPTIGETDNGGGLNLGDGVSATLMDVKVTANSSTDHGGGIWIGSSGSSSPPSSVLLTRVEVSGNSAGLGAGGGLYNLGWTTLTDSIITNNSGGFSGGIDNSSILTLELSTVSLNQGVVGGISTDGTSISTITDSAVVANLGSAGAGGISAAGATVITNSTISGNMTDQEGGGLFVWGDTTLMGTTISDNRAGTDGGGVYVWVTEGPGLSLTNTTVSGNEADREGGGIFVLAGTVDLSNTTVASNKAASGGAVAYSDVPAQRELRASNTIFSGNAPPSCTAELTSLGHNLEDSDSCGLTDEGDLSDADALLAPLGDNGGPTLTHTLLNGSPAIDSGDPDACPQRDQRGAPRPFDGDDMNGASCDIGALELGAQVPPPPPHIAGDADCNGVIEAVDALAVLRHVAGFPPLAACVDVADVNCSEAIDAVDALWIVRYVVALPVEPPPECPSVGTLV